MNHLLNASYWNNTELTYLRYLTIQHDKPALLNFLLMRRFMKEQIDTIIKAAK